jgi:phosphatidylinositol glycan class V
VFEKEYRGVMLAYTVHLLFLVGFGIVNMHVQVLTRLLFSSSPVLYWFTAMVISDAVSLPHSSSPSSYTLPLLLRKLTAVFHSKSRLAKLIILYFLVFVILGFLLHCNFFPWT